MVPIPEKKKQKKKQTNKKNMRFIKQQNTNPMSKIQHILLGNIW